MIGPERGPLYGYRVDPTRGGVSNISRGYIRPLKEYGDWKQNLNGKVLQRKGVCLLKDLAMSRIQSDPKIQLMTTANNACYGS